MSARVEGLPLVGPTTTSARRRRAAELLRDYINLTKPRIMALLIITELTSMIVVKRGWPGAGQVAVALAGGACASGGASALNCWYDRNLDRLMHRTRNRPLPAGRIAPIAALAFGITLTLVAGGLLWTLANPLAALLAMAGSVYYVVLYTMALKRHTRQNIVIGGAAGAFPVLVGSAIATGRVSWLALDLFAIVFFWTPPHFWSLALLLRRDYSGAKVPMLPSVASARYTHRSMLGYLLVLVAVSLLPATTLGLWYAVPVALLDAYYLMLAVQALRVHSDRISARLFRYSLVYLAALFACSAAAALALGPA